MTALFFPLPDDRQETERLFAAHVNRGKLDTYKKYDFDVVMGRREGVRFWDQFSDRSFINCHSNGGVFNLGHRHPEVRRRLAGALETLDLGNHHLVSGYRARLADRLVATTEGRLPACIFGVSGGEAVDVAIKAARAATGRGRIVSMLGGYHGHTGLALAAGDAQYRAPFGPSAGDFVQVPFDDLDALEAVMDDGVAGVIVEPIPATLGMPIPSPGYLTGVEAVCRAHGAKFIVDEVQTGLGRTGDLWFHRIQGLQPDAVVTGKGLSGGYYPITATLLTEEMHRVFAESPFIHISTFGGAELGCVAALTVLDLLEAPGFLSHVAALAARFAEGLSGLSFELRQQGLMMGFKFPVPEAGLMAAKMALDAGLFCAWANNDTSVLQFMPPLVMTEAEADETIAIVRGLFG